MFAAKRIALFDDCEAELGAQCGKAQGRQRVGKPAADKGDITGE